MIGIAEDSDPVPTGVMSIPRPKRVLIAIEQLLGLELQHCKICLVMWGPDVVHAFRSVLVRVYDLYRDHPKVVRTVRMCGLIKDQSSGSPRLARL